MKLDIKPTMRSANRWMAILCTFATLASTPSSSANEKDVKSPITCLTALEEQFNLFSQTVTAENALVPVSQSGQLTAIEEESAFAAFEKTSLLERTRDNWVRLNSEVARVLHLDFHNQLAIFISNQATAAGMSDESAKKLTAKQLDKRLKAAIKNSGSRDGVMTELRAFTRDYFESKLRGGDSINKTILDLYKEFGSPDLSDKIDKRAAASAISAILSVIDRDSFLQTALNSFLPIGSKLFSKGYSYHIAFHESHGLIEKRKFFVRDTPLSFVGLTNITMRSVLYTPSLAVLANGMLLSSEIGWRGIGLIALNAFVVGAYNLIATERDWEDRTFYARYAPGVREAVTIAWSRLGQKARRLANTQKIGVGYRIWRLGNRRWERRFADAIDQSLDADMQAQIIALESINRVGDRLSAMRSAQSFISSVNRLELSSDWDLSQSMDSDSESRARGSEDGFVTRPQSSDELIRTYEEIRDLTVKSGQLGRLQFSQWDYDADTAFESIRELLFRSNDSGDVARMSTYQEASESLLNLIKSQSALYSKLVEAHLRLGRASAILMATLDHEDNASLRRAFEHGFPGFTYNHLLGLTKTHLKRARHFGERIEILGQFEEAGGKLLTTTNKLEARRKFLALEEIRHEFSELRDLQE